MYTLRKIIEGMEFNQEIGTQYQVIDRTTNYEKFAEAFNLCLGYRHVADLDTESDQHTKNCYTILVINKGAEMIPLYIGQSNYIMTETGKTFSNLSIKH